MGTQIQACLILKFWLLTDRSYCFLPSSPRMGQLPTSGAKVSTHDFMTRGGTPSDSVGELTKGSITHHSNSVRRKGIYYLQKIFILMKPLAPRDEGVVISTLKARSTRWFGALTRFYSACEETNVSVITVFCVSGENCIAQQSLSYILEINGVFGGGGEFGFFLPTSVINICPAE